ncbi:MAG: glycosyltransferase, partial [Acidimicrobiia bacterium]|nr:glycosyltransferase [Acidimicrobiia bacterium]
MLRLLDHGRLLYGGSPPRFIKLTEAGRQQALALLAPEHAGAKPESIDPPLRGRLVNAGMLAPAQPLHASLPTFGVVIPHFNDPGGAADSVATLMWASSGSPGPSPAVPWIVVVDDGSAPAARQQLHRLLDPLSPTVEIVDHPVNGGPGAARNAGATAVDAQVI